MANTNGGRINFQVGYNVDQNSVSQVKKSLQDLQNIKFSSFKGSLDDLKEIEKVAGLVEKALDSAFNVNLNSLNSQEFMKSLNSMEGGIQDIYNTFAKAGTQGQIAFNNVTRSVLTTNLQLKLTKSLINSMGLTMANTVKWGIASSIMNSFSNSVQQAFQYVKSLDSALTDIRIVTGDSTEEMRNFAVLANNAAQVLGRSTMDYTKAALTFYQQGLSDLDVQARTQAVLKAQNVTGAGLEMADYLTAVWNGYKVANEEAELYVDKLAAVADSSASNMALLATAMSKVASSANALGVPVDNLNAQIATIVATTRQAPESVGNALKTIYARINDISTGALDALVSLGNYSKQMAGLGFSVLDANGNLRETGDVLDEIGGKWLTLSRLQQIYLARTMAGQRQYNNLIALFDNWGKYTDLVNVSLNSQGSLMEKNERYMDSLGAKMEQFGAAGERVKDALINEEDLKNLVDFGTDIVNVFGSLVESLGGGGAAIANFAALFASLFSGTISKEINNVITNIQNAKANINILRNDITATKTFSESGIDSAGTKIVTLKMQAMQQYYSVMDKESINAQKNLIDELGQLENQKVALDKNIENLERYAQEKAGVSSQDLWDKDKTGIEAVALALGLLQGSASNAQDIFTAYQNGTKSFDDMLRAVQSFVDEYNLIDPEKAKKLQEALNSLNTSDASSVSSFVNLLNNGLQDANSKALIYSNTLKNGQIEQQKLNLQTRNLSTVIDENTKKAGQLFNITAITKFATGISQVAMGINNIANLTKIWKNLTLSTGEKVLQTFTNVGFTLMSIVNIYKSIQGILKAIMILGETELIREKRKTIEKQKQALLLHKITLEKIAQNNADVTGDIINGPLKATEKEISLLDGGLKGLNSSSLTGGLKTIGSNIIGFIASPAGVATIAIAALAVALYATYKEWNKLALAAKKASLIAADAKKNYKLVKLAYDNLKASLEDYNESQKAILSMTKGTQLWRDAIRESNDAVLLLLNNYPQLSKYILSVNGQLKISEEGQQKALELQSSAVNAARLASIETSRDSRDANVRAAAANIGHNAWYTVAQGGQSYTTYTSSLNVLAIAEAIRTKIPDFEEGQFSSAMAEAIQKETGLPLEEINSVLSSGQDEIIKLNQLIATNTEATKLAFEGMASEAFADEDTYKLFDDLLKQVADTLGGSLLLQRTALIQDKWMKTLTDGVAIWSGAANENVQSMLLAFNKANNSNWQLDPNAVRGTDTNRTFAFVTEDGLTKTLRAEQIAATIAAQLALELLDLNLAKTSTLISDLNDSSKYSDTQSNAIKNFISGNGFGDLTEGLLDSLFQTNIGLLFKLHEEEFKALGYEDAMSLSKAFSAQIHADKKVFEDAGHSAFESVNNAILGLSKEGLTANAVKNIEKSFTDAFKFAGLEGLNSLNTLFKNFEGKDLQKVSEIISNIDWTQDGAAYLLTKALKLQGIVVNDDVEGWNDFIIQLENVPKAVGNATSAIDTLKNTLSQINELKDIKTGDIIDDLAYLELIKLNPLLEKFFRISADGMMYMGANGGLSSVLASTTDQLKANFKAEGSAALALSRIDMAEVLGEFSFGLEDTIDVARARNISATQSFQNALTYLGVSELSLQEAINTVLQYQDNLDLTSKQQEQLNAAKATILNVYSLMMGMQADFENDMYSDDVLSQLLATSSTTMVLLVDLFENGLVHAEDFAAALRQVSDVEMSNLGFDVDEYEDYVSLLRATNEEYAENLYLARQVAKANMRITKGTLDLISNWLDYTDAILDFKLSADPMALALDWGELSLTLANTLNMDKLSIDMLGPDFVANNWAKIQDVKNGVEGAWEDLQDLASNQIEFNLQANLPPLEFAKIQDDINYIQDLANSADLLIGVAISGDDLIIDRFNNIALAAGWTSLQAQAAFAAMGYDVEVVGQEGQMHKEQLTTSYYVPPTYSVKKMQWDLGPFGSGDLIVPIETSVGHYETATGGYKESYLPGAYSIRTVTPNGKGYGGNISRNTVKGSAPRSSGGSGGRGGRSSSPKSSTPKTTSIDIKTTPDRTLKKEADYDPYLQNTKALERQEDVIEDLQDAEKKLLDKDRLENLEKQNEALKEQAKILLDRLAISLQAGLKNTTAWFAKELQSAFGNNIGFDADGRIADRNKALAAAVAAYNTAVTKADKEYLAALAKYNANAGKQLNDAQKKQILNLLKAAEDKKKKAIDKAKELYDEKTKLLDSYEKAWQEDEKTREEIEKLWDQIYENRIIQSKITVDLKIDAGDFERDYLDFENKVIKKLQKDDYLGQAKANMKLLASYFNSGLLEATQKQIEFIREQIDIMQKGGKSDTYGDNLAQAQEDLENYMKLNMLMLLKIQDLRDLIQENYLDAIDKARDKMDDQIDQYERVNSLIEHNVKLTLLLYGDKAYDTMEKYYQKRRLNDLAELDSLRRQQLYWQQKMDNETPGSEAWLRFKKNVDDATDKLNSKLEDMIQTLSDQWENRVDGIILKLNNALTGGRGLDYLDEQWDYINDYDDKFLDTVESKMGIQDVENLYNNAIDGLAGNPKAQQRINNLMKDQLKILKEKDHLTEYDLERAKAMLQVEQARMDLEDARNNKTKMRLRRDSQGNYTYQYVADEEKLGDLQDALADAQANLYNMDKLHYKQNLNDLYDTYKDYLSKMKLLTAAYNATQDLEERARIQSRIDLLKDSTLAMMDGLTEDNQVTLYKYLGQSYADAMGIDLSSFTQEEQFNILRLNVPQVASNIQDLADTIIGEGGILPATAAYMLDIAKATKEYDLNVELYLAAAGTSLETVRDVYDEDGKYLDENIQRANDLITANDKLIQSCDSEIQAIQLFLSYLDKYLDKAMDIETLVANLRAGFNTIEQTYGSNITADELKIEQDISDTTTGRDYSGSVITDNAAQNHELIENFKVSNAVIAENTASNEKLQLAIEEATAQQVASNDDSSSSVIQQQQQDTAIANAATVTNGLVDILRALSDKDIATLQSLISSSLGNINNVEELNQNVHIEANFPNVNASAEVESAFISLVNTAAMATSKYQKG